LAGERAARPFLADVYTALDFLLLFDQAKRREIKSKK